MDSLRPHETLALQMLLNGEHPILAKLRAQACQAQVAGRKHTGVGEYIDLAVPSGSEPVEPTKVILGDVRFAVEGVKHGADVLLFVTDGRLSFIEFVTVADEWPASPIVRGSSYYREVETAPGRYAFEPCIERDTATLARALLGLPGSSGDSIRNS